MTSEVLISAVVSGTVSLLVNLIIERRREKRADRIETRKERKEAFETRPELDIVGYEDHLSQVGDAVEQKCDIELFVSQIKNVTTTGKGRQDIVYAHYYEDDVNLNEWCCVVYKFENKGKTDISALDIICNHKKTTCIFPCDSMQHREATNSLSYWCCYDKKIRVGETITIKLCYHKDRIPSGMFSAIMSIGLEDVNSRYWTQPLFAPEDKIYSSKEISYKEYREQIRTDVAEECFKQPWLW